MIAGTAAGAIAIRSGPSIGCGETRSEIAGTAAGPVATYVLWIWHWLWRD